MEMPTRLVPPEPPSLYVHIPFCLSRCSYCAFTSSVLDPHRADSYLDALECECQRRVHCFGNSKPTTLFIGGGTPSCLSLVQLDRLFSFLPMPDHGEATCELNPDSTTPDKLDLLQRVGITRCSFGVQTFSPEGLRLLGRRHDAKTAEKVVKNSLKKDFFSVNVDLITAWPGQSEAVLRSDLARAMDLGVTHISCYNLMVEENSQFSAVMNTAGLEEKPDDEVRRFWDITIDYLTSQGFEHYETSNFAKPGYRCQHNVDIWKGKEYCGLGAAAHSHMHGRRFANTADIDQYNALSMAGKNTEVFSEQLEGEAKARECAVFWFRLIEGIDIGEFRQRTGYDLFALYKEELPRLIADGIVEKENSMVRIAKQYHPVLDAVLVDLI